MQPEIQMTEEQTKESQARLKDFEVKFNDLCKEHNVELMVFPQYVPSQFGATTVCQVAFRDLKYMPVKSPFTPDQLK